jgi:hypothetical protein
MSKNRRRGRNYLRKRSVADRYAVTPRSIERWVKKKVLPPPMYLPGVEFPLWAEDELDAHDRRAAQAAH